MKKHLLLAAAAVSILGACSAEPDAAEDSGPVDGGTIAEGGAPAEDAPITSLGEEQTAWSFKASPAEGATLTYFQPAGMPVMRMTCRRDPARFEVAVPQVDRIGSEERLTFGVGGRLQAMPVPLSIPAGGPVMAEVPLSPELVASFAGGDFAATYGASVVTPESLPRDEVLTRFANACEAALSVRAAETEREQIRSTAPPE